MTIGGILMQDYRAFGWFTLAASAIAGGVIVAALMIMFRKKIFERWVARELKIKNDRLTRGMHRIEAVNKELEAENARLRSNWGQAVVKATQGVSVVLSAFGLEPPDLP